MFYWCKVRMNCSFEFVWLKTQFSFLYFVRAILWSHFLQRLTTFGFLVFLVCFTFNCFVILLYLSFKVWLCERGSHQDGAIGIQLTLRITVIWFRRTFPLTMMLLCRLCPATFFTRKWSFRENWIVWYLGKTGLKVRSKHRLAGHLEWKQFVACCHIHLARIYATCRAFTLHLLSINWLYTIVINVPACLRFLA